MVLRKTLNNLRKEFWITRGRNRVRKIIHECVLCNRLEGKCYSYPQQPPLPSSRMIYKKPFSRPVASLKIRGATFAPRGKYWGLHCGKD